MKIENFRELFHIGLCYAYDCEQKLVKKGLPTMIDAASTPELRNALEQHLQETRTHVPRLERVFSILGAEAKTKDDDVMYELADGAKTMIGATDASPLRDAALIVSGNQV